jgi:hypothetical protein
MTFSRTPLLVMRLLVICLLMSLIVTGCKHTVRDDQVWHDPCSLVSKSDVEKIVGTSVTGTVVETEHAVSMAAGKVMHGTASCTYSLEGESGKPARIKVSIDTYRDRQMMLFDFTSWKGAQHVSGIGDEAWQDTTALEILTHDKILVIETDQTSESPREPIPPSEETRDYPTIQTALARIALGRL